MSNEPQVQLAAFKIHNRTGSTQFTLQPAFFAGETFTTQAGEVRVMKKGHVMVEMANATGQTDKHGNIVYDWANKIAMKFSDVDLHQLLDGLQGRDCKIVHDPNKADAEKGAQLPKSCFLLSKGERFGFFMSMSRGEKKTRCPVNDADAANLRLLLPRAIVRIYGW
jgi:hypothetical protein